MSSILRRVRGALGTAVTWAVGWALGGSAILATILIAGGALEFFAETIVPVAVTSAISGFFTGTVFSLVLGTVHRNKRLGDLKAWRMALWGTGAALLVPAGIAAVSLAAGISISWDDVWQMATIVGVLGAGTAGGTIKLAQWADRDQVGAGEEAGRLEGTKEDV